MTTAVLVVIVVILLALAASRVLGRATYEVESGDETKYAELGGVWVRYRVSGGGPPVLLVHDLLASGRIWESLARELSEEFTVYCVDLPGFGESDKPLSGYGVRQGSRVLHAFCARFGISRAAVVGHGVGGDMAVKLAADHPDAVSSLTLVATPAMEGQLDLPSPVWLATRPVVGPLFFGALRASRLWRRVGLRPFVFEREDLPGDFVEDAGRSTPSALARTVSALRRELSRERLLQQADRVQIPVLIVSGEDDRIVNPGSVESWTDVFPRSRKHLIEACGHLPMIEQAGEFNEIVRAFLTGNGDIEPHDEPASGSKSPASGEREAGETEQRKEDDPRSPETLFGRPDRRNPGDGSRNGREG